jgi:hypothetical protein
MTAAAMLGPSSVLPERLATEAGIECDETQVKHHCFDTWAHT